MSGDADRLLQIRPFGKDIKIYIDGSKCSCGTYSNNNYKTNKDNNAILVERRVVNEDTETYIGLVELRALKVIKEYEEILVDYGSDYWKSDKRVMLMKESEEWAERQAQLLQQTSCFVNNF